MTKPLGKEQQGVLRSLKDHGSYPGQWVWSNRSTTVRLLESLVKRGLVVKTIETFNPLISPSYQRLVYRLATAVPSVEADAAVHGDDDEAEMMAVEMADKAKRRAAR